MGVTLSRIVTCWRTINTLVDFFVSLLILFILLLIYQVPITLSILILPALLILSMLLSIGVGVIFAALNVYYRDFTYVLPFVIQVWMFASPLAYSTLIIPDSLSWLYKLNPMVGVIDGFRWAIFQSTTFPLNSILYSCATSVSIFIIGMLIFRRLESRFADVI